MSGENSTGETSSTESLSTENVTLLVEQVRALVQLNQAAIQASTAERTAMTEQYEGLLAGVIDLVARVEATLDVQEQLMGTIGATIEELKQVTGQLIEVQNNLILLMTEGMEQ